MIRFNKQVSQNISIAVWQITENEDCFWKLLHLFPEDEQSIKNIKLQSVRLQKLACRAALASLLGRNEIGITYSETGQPLLKEHYISFSHTTNYVAVALAKTPVGIDLEEITSRILPLYKRFMSPQEMADCNTDNLQDLYYYWCAKEAMYKWFTEKSIDFIEDLRVYKNENKGVVCKKNELTLMEILLENQLIMTCWKRE